MDDAQLCSLSYILNKNITSYMGMWDRIWFSGRTSFKYRDDHQSYVGNLSRCENNKLYSLECHNLFKLTGLKINFVKYWSMGHLSQILTGQNASFNGRYVASEIQSPFSEFCK